MSDRVYKMVELVGTSQESVTDAIERAVGRASATLRNLKWFEVTEIRGGIADGKISLYQVTLKAGFTLEGE